MSGGGRGAGGGWRRVVLLALLALVAAVCAWRAVDLARHGWHPSAPGEHRWMGWGQGNGWERAVLAALPERPPATGGAELILAVETPGGVRPNWLRAQVQYLWPGRQVAGVEVVKPGEGAEGAAAPSDDGRRGLRLTVAAPQPEGPPTAGTMVPPRPARDLASLAVFLLAALGLGVLLLPRSARRPAAFGPVFTAVFGTSVLVPVGLLAMTWGPGWNLEVVLPALAGALWLLLFGLTGEFVGGLTGRWPRRDRVQGPAWTMGRGWTAGPEWVWWRWGRGRSPRGGGSRDGWALAAAAVLALALALFAAKVIAAPLWSWDHHSIWGLKARVLGAEGPQWGLLESTALERSSTSYPLGLPVLAWAAALGDPPSPPLFQAVHLLCGVGLVLLVGGAVRRAGGTRLAATTVAAWVAASPLLWDTELLGLADLPLALWAMAAVWLLASPELHRSHLLAAGAVLGFLPWIKGEGMTLALLLLAAGVAWVHRHHRLRAAGWLALPCAVQLLLLHWSHSLLGVHGEDFFAGDWPARLEARLGQAGPVLLRLGRELAAPHWLGGWVVFAVAAGLLLVAQRLVAHRSVARRAALLLTAVVLAQLAVYAGVYLVTYLDPMAHVESSFRRIAAALWPLAAVAAAMGMDRGAGDLGVGGAPVRREPGCFMNARRESAERAPDRVTRSDE